MRIGHVTAGTGFWVMAGLLTVVSGCGNAAGAKEASSRAPLATGQYSAGSTIQAEAFTSKSNSYPQLENNNSDMGFFDAGTWYCFDGVDLTNVPGLDLQIAAANAGGVFSVRIDGDAGTEIGRYTVSTATGEWTTWQTRTMAITATTGVHSLCLRGETGGGILNLDWLKLNTTVATYRLGDTLQAESFTSKSSPYPHLENNNTDMGFFDTGTWLCFDGVDMTSVSSLDLRLAAANTGGVFTVRLGGSTGTEIGRYAVSTATGGWSSWQTRSVPLTASSGVHTLCLRGESGYGICNTDSITLTGASSVWTGTWATAPQSCGDGFNQQTLRQVVRTSISGSSARVRLSNVFGTQTLNVSDVHTAQRASGSSIVSSTDRKVTFGGSSTTSIPVGGEVVSDAISFPVNSLADVVVSLYFPGPTGQVTCHQSGFQTNYVAAGDVAGNETLSVQQTRGSYYVLTNLDVQNASAEGAVVTLGASITDGYVSSSDQNHRWPNYLATRLNSAGRTIGVVNEGISGNRLLADGSGQSALNRFDRDVLAQANVKWVIISDDPINDLGNGTAAGDQLVSGLQTLIARAHQAGVKVLCSTLTPFQGANYWTSAGEAGRTTVNAFVRSSSSGCDGVIDQDTATHDPARSTWYLPAYDAGDHLHPNEAGLQAIANSVGLNLFVP